MAAKQHHLMDQPERMVHLNAASLKCFEKSDFMLNNRSFDEVNTTDVHGDIPLDLSMKKPKGQDDQKHRGNTDQVTTSYSLVSVESGEKEVGTILDIKKEPEENVAIDDRILAKQGDTSTLDIKDEYTCSIPGDQASIESVSFKDKGPKRCPEAMQLKDLTLDMDDFGKGLHTCQICNTTFTKSSHLESHMKLHAHEAMRETTNRSQEEHITESKIPQTTLKIKRMKVNMNFSKKPKTKLDSSYVNQHLLKGNLPSKVENIKKNRQSNKNNIAVSPQKTLSPQIKGRKRKVEVPDLKVKKAKKIKNKITKQEASIDKNKKSDYNNDCQFGEMNNQKREKPTTIVKTAKQPKSLLQSESDIIAKYSVWEVLDANQNEVLKCTICYRTFESVLQFRHHMHGAMLNEVKKLTKNTLDQKKLRPTIKNASFLGSHCRFCNHGNYKSIKSVKYHEKYCSENEDICRNCYMFETDNKEDLAKHVQECSKLSHPAYTCPGCSVGFVIRSDYIYHKNWCFKSHQCPICHDTMSQKEFKRHAVVCFNGSNKSLICPMCNQEFDSVPLADKHRLTCFKCVACDQDFSSWCNLRDHMLVCMRQEKAGCKPRKDKLCFYCGVMFPANLGRRQADKYKRHIQQHEKDYRYSCSLCDKQFVEKYKLKIHMSVHTTERPHSCDVCGDKFKTINALANHMTFHSERKYQCQLCDASFQNPMSLTRHQVVHSGERKYKCNRCDKTFTQKSSLKRHENVHDGVRAFKCEECKISFTQRYPLTVHMEKMHAVVSSTKKKNKRENFKRRELFSSCPVNQTMEPPSHPHE
ncbi:unnamed protein product [Owenia fusiformis]|uniref:Uncharacterized protein n=1 Tax=Owenia fusiformis TaxID=6347 RepID=A0A8J1UNU6_OWEFU|nr:unnamed protein product [Owenia fusiformis]